MSDKIVVPLYEGTFSVGTDQVFRRIDRQGSPNKGALKLSINPFLIKNGSKNILFDAGLGELFGTDTSIQTILSNLEEEGIADYEISDIFLSHLHFDHMGGLANRENGYWELTFPDAVIWVSEKAWKKLYNLIDNLDQENQDFFHFLDSKADIKFIPESGTALENVRAEHIGGHTEFHQALYFESGDQKYIMAGDVIGSRGVINRTYAAKYDFDPQQSLQARKKLQEMAYQKGYTLMTYHETDFPLFKLTEYDEKKGYKIENVS